MQRGGEKDYNLNMEILTKNTEETRIIAYNFAKILKPNQTTGTIVGLYGELGAGKTAFVKYLAESFGVKEEIQSPTFVIMKKYELKNASRKAQEKQKLPNSRLSNFQTLCHIDAYRIEKEEEMLNLGWEKIVADPKNLICVEWPERIQDIMPKGHIKMFFEHLSENERKITINQQ